MNVKHEEGELCCALSDVAKCSQDGGSDDNVSVERNTKKECAEDESEASPKCCCEWSSESDEIGPALPSSEVQLPVPTSDDEVNAVVDNIRHTRAAIHVSIDTLSILSSMLCNMTEALRVLRPDAAKEVKQ